MALLGRPMPPPKTAPRRSPPRKMPLPLMKDMRDALDTGDVKTDQWASKIFSIINTGPSGGFVRYMIDSRNRLVVEKTGNRSNPEDIVNELLPENACRYVAYSFRYEKAGVPNTKLVWFLWTPKSAPEKEPTRYANGLVSTLIGLNAQSSIPILKGDSATDLAPEAILQLL